MRPRSVQAWPSLPTPLGPFFGDANLVIDGKHKLSYSYLSQGAKQSPSKVFWCPAVRIPTSCSSRYTTFIDIFAVTVAGLVFGAESALLAHEAERRQEENVLRKQARYDLARRGLIATESEIAKWRTERDESSGSS